ncbi:MAG: peptidylprolyl isomerase [Clostridiales Family XIII bacterium]|jgi:peptidyl-prolyl cis-trans isomerase B (cyclophilin B)|nr:peptidylprolyl isomerase [Clostridiales Family XIII bacterium]
MKKKSNTLLIALVIIFIILILGALSLFLLEKFEVIDLFGSGSSQSVSEIDEDDEDVASRDRPSDTGAGREDGAAAIVSGKEESAVGSGATGSAPFVEITMADGGKILLELDGSAAPITVNNFVKLVNEGFYDGLIFHRVIKNFMIQGGDNGVAGSVQTITGEFSSNGVDNPISHEPGVISMARSGDPNSASSQFFIVTGNATHLDGDYAAFGHVVSGMDVVEKIEKVKTDAHDKPIDDVVISSIRVIE